MTVSGPGEEQMLDPRYVPQQRLVARILALGATAASLVLLLIVLVAAGGLTTAARVGAGLAWFTVMLGLAWHAETWPARRFAHTRFRLDADGLQIRRGVWWRTVTHVPRERIQHTDVSQGPLERTYGLGTLVVYTAGTQYARVALPGLSHQAALALREELRAGRGDDGV